MSVRPQVEAMVTNIATGGQWIVVQTVTTRHGPFKDYSAAVAFAEQLDGEKR